MDGSDPRGRVLSAEQGDTLRDYGEGEVRRQGTRNRMPTQLLNIRSHSSMWYNDLPSDSKPPFPSAEGEGRRVRRWWRLDGKWYTGTVGRSYFDTLTLTVRTLVCYDDGEKRYEDMSKGRWLEGDGNGEDEQPPSSDGESDDGLPVDASDEEAEEAEVEEVDARCSSRERACLARARSSSFSRQSSWERPAETMRCRSPTVPRLPSASAEGSAAESACDEKPVLSGSRWPSVVSTYDAACTLRKLASSKSR